MFRNRKNSGCLASLKKNLYGHKAHIPAGPGCWLLDGVAPVHGSLHQPLVLPTLKLSVNYLLSPSLGYFPYIFPFHSLQIICLAPIGIHTVA